MTKTLVFILATLLLLCLAVYFIRKKQEPTTPISAFKTNSLHEAAETGDLELVKQILNKDNLESLNEFGQTALLIAVDRDHLEVARLLLSSGASIEYQYKREKTAAERDKQKKMYTGMFKQEFEEETFRDLPDEIKEEINSDKFQRELEESMIDLHFQLTKEHVMGNCQSLSMLKLLVLENGADIDHIDTGDWALSTFAEADDFEAVKWLLENKAKPNNTSTGETAIYKAIANNNLEMVQLFLKHGASLDVFDVDGCGPLWVCHSVEMAKLLIGNGVDTTTTDQVGFPTWHFVEDKPTRKYIEADAKKREG